MVAEELFGVDGWFLLGEAFLENYVGDGGTLVLGF
jgi:hypothetical protein